MTSKMVMFPSIGRVEKVDAFERAFTEIRVRHEMEMVPPQQSDDYFRIRDNIKAEAEVVAVIPSINPEDKKAPVETTVHRFVIEVPPVLMNFFDSPVYNRLKPENKAKYNTRARTIQRFLEAQEAQTRFDERMHDEPAPHQGYGHGQGGTTTLSLPGVHHGMNPSPRRAEISQLEFQGYEAALLKFREFIDGRNAKAQEEVLPVRKFFTMLREQHGPTPEIEKIIADLEKRIASEINRAIQFVGE